MGRANGRSNGNFKHGLFSGFEEYRYGPAKPVTLARLNIERPVLSEGKRKHLVGRLADEMKDWRTSPFEQEGALIHSFRAELCLQGNNWPVSNAISEGLVHDALRHLGAERPTWAEGQPEATSSPDQCSWCAGPIDVVQGTGQHSNIRFCSAVCAQSAFESKDFTRRSEHDKAYSVAVRMIRQSKTKVRACLECGTPFQPLSDNSKQECCSQPCSAKRRWRINPPPIAVNGALMCCAFCGNDFVSKSRKAIHCSNACRQAGLRERRGVVPRSLLPHVFDRHFTNARRNVVQPLTAKDLDWFFLERGIRITSERMAA